MYEINAIRLQPSEDGTHDHIFLVGYESPHMPGESIMVPPARVLQRQALGDKFWVAADDDKASIEASTCPECGFGPQLKTSADTAERALLWTLPRE